LPKYQSSSCGSGAIGIGIVGTFDSRWSARSITGSNSITCGLQVAGTEAFVRTHHLQWLLSPSRTTLVGVSTVAVSYFACWQWRSPTISYDAGDNGRHELLHSIERHKLTKYCRTSKYFAKAVDSQSLRVGRSSSLASRTPSRVGWFHPLVFVKLQRTYSRPTAGVRHLVLRTRV